MLYKITSVPFTRRRTTSLSRSLTHSSLSRDREREQERGRESVHALTLEFDDLSWVDAGCYLRRRRGWTLSFGYRFAFRISKPRAICFRGPVITTAPPRANDPFLPTLYLFASGGSRRSADISKYIDRGPCTFHRVGHYGKANAFIETPCVSISSFEYTPCDEVYQIEECGLRWKEIRTIERNMQMRYINMVIRSAGNCLKVR